MNEQITAVEAVRRFPHILASHDAPCEIRGGQVYCETYLGPSWRQCQGSFYVPTTPDLHCLAIIAGAYIVGNAYEGDSKTIAAILRGLGYPLPIPGQFTARKLQIFANGRNEIFIRCGRHKDDSQPTGWASPGAEKRWEIYVGPGPYQPNPVLDQATYEDHIRLVEYDGCGVWFIRTDDDDPRWRRVNVESARRAAMVALDISKTEAEKLLGRLERSPWIGKAIPFADEYPGGRIWNQYPIGWNKITPCKDWRVECPTWLKMLEHIGSDLGPGGTDWLFTWLASVVQKPFAPTPYLFLFGPEDCGKSILHESFDLLVNRGVVRADRALTSRGDFNGELAGCLLAVVEEKNIAKAPGAYAKIKDAVTSRQLSIRKMRVDSYMIDNMTHWIQCSNDPSACPIFDRQTRIQPIYVGRLANPIPKSAFLAALKSEGGKFAHALANAKLPDPTSRLSLQIIETTTSQRLADAGRPEWILALPMVIGLEWSGTAKDLIELLARETTDLPATMRKIRSTLESHKLYLSRHFLDWEVEEAANDHHPQKLTIRRTL